jgi:hypothetical protein
VTDTPGKTWFFGGSVAEEPVTRTCTAPVRRQLFFPVVNVVIIPGPGNTQKQLRTQASGGWALGEAGTSAAW